MGIKRASELGVYLGHVHHHGSDRRANSKLLEGVRKRLNGWKTVCLSRTGRLTLAKFVINSMSLFQMKVQRLPQVCIRSWTDL